MSHVKSLSYSSLLTLQNSKKQTFKIVNKNMFYTQCLSGNNSQSLARML